MATKRKPKSTPKQPRRRVTPQQVAEILSFADKATMGRAAAEFGLAERSLWRWKARVESGKWPEVADLVRELKAESLDRCKDLLAEVYELALTEMKQKIPNASYKELLETVVETGGLKVFRETLDAGSKDPQSGAGGSANAGPTAGAPGAAGIQKTLRVVG